MSQHQLQHHHDDDTNASTAAAAATSRRGAFCSAQIYGGVAFVSGQVAVQVLGANKVAGN